MIRHNPFVVRLQHSGAEFDHACCSKFQIPNSGATAFNACSLKVNPMDDRPEDSVTTSTHYTHTHTHTHTLYTNTRFTQKILAADMLELQGTTFTHVKEQIYACTDRQGRGSTVWSMHV